MSDEISRRQQLLDEASTRVDRARRSHAEPLPFPHAANDDELCYVKTWKQLHKQYCDELKLRKARHERAGEQKSTLEAKLEFLEIVAKYRDRLLAGFDEFDIRYGCKALLLQASAVYDVVYSHAIDVNKSMQSTHAGGGDGAAIQGGHAETTRDFHVAFAWHVAGEYLCWIKSGGLRP